MCSSSTLTAICQPAQRGISTALSVATAKNVGKVSSRRRFRQEFRRRTRSTVYRATQQYNAKIYPDVILRGRPHPLRQEVIKPLLESAAKTVGASAETEHIALTLIVRHSLISCAPVAGETVQKAEQQRYRYAAALPPSPLDLPECALGELLPWRLRSPSQALCSTSS